MRSVSPYGVQYIARICAAAFLVLTYWLSLLAFFVLLQKRIIESFQWLGWFAGIIFFVDIVIMGYLFVLACWVIIRLVRDRQMRLSARDCELSWWASNQTNRRVTVYHSGWAQTYSSVSLFGGRKIYVGTEALGLSESALSFLILHEIAHLTAPRARLRSLETMILRGFEALNELRAKNSSILLRRVPAAGSPFRFMRSIFTAREHVGLFYFPVLWITFVLGLVQGFVPLLLRPLIRLEELYADQVAAEKFGSGAVEAIGACANFYSRFEGMSEAEQVAVSAHCLRRWTFEGIDGVRSAIADSVGQIKLRQTEPRLGYPSWQERVTAIQQKARTGSAELDRISCKPLTIVLGDRLKLWENTLTCYVGPTFNKMRAAFIGQAVIALFNTLFVQKTDTDFLLGFGVQLLISFLTVGIAMKNMPQFDLKRQMPFSLLLENEDRCFPVLCMVLYSDPVRRTRDFFSIHRWRETHFLQTRYAPRAIARRIFALARNDAIILTKSLAFTAFGDVVVRGRWGRSEQRMKGSGTPVPADSQTTGATGS